MKRKKNQSNNRWKLVISGVIAIILLSLLGQQYYFQNRFRFIKVGNVNLLGLTVKQATDKLNQLPHYNKDTYLVFPDMQVKVTQDQVQQLFDKQNQFLNLKPQRISEKQFVTDQDYQQRIKEVLPSLQKSITKLNLNKTKTKQPQAVIKNYQATVYKGIKGNDFDADAMVASFKKQAPTQLTIAVKKTPVKYFANNGPEIKKQMAALTELMGREVVVKGLKETMTIPASEYIKTAWYSQSAQRYVFKAPKLGHKMAAYAKSVETFGKPVTIKNYYGKMTKIKGGTLGWRINKAKLTKAIFNEFNQKHPQTINLKQYVTGTGYGLKGMGKSYVEVDLKNLMEYVYVNGKLVVKTPIMSGTIGGGNETPQGAFFVMYKQRNSVLRGFNDDGSKYASPVNYWVPITTTGVGFHDSPWQPASVYGNPEARATRHSHGCLNNPPAVMGQVYSAMTVNMPVAIYY